MRKTIFTLVAIMVVMFVSCGGGGSNDPVSDQVPFEPLKAQSIEVSPKKMTLHLGLYSGMIAETKFLKAKVYPAEAQHNFTWGQYDCLVVLGSERRSDSLSVYACEVGETDIVLEETYSGLKDTCHITVSDEIVPVEKISFDNVTFDLYEGQANRLFATTYPNYTTDSLLWRSEDADIAYVDNDYFWATESGGLAHTVWVEAIKPGSTNVVATTKDGKVTAKYYLTVKGVTDIKLDKTELELYESQQGTLNVAVLPEEATKRNIVWRSENEEIAKVTVGDFDPYPLYVIGGRPGETNIVGTSYDGKITVKCHVTVKNNNTIDYHPYGDDEQW